MLYFGFIRNALEKYTKINSGTHFSFVVADGSLHVLLTLELGL